MEDGKRLKLLGFSRLSAAMSVILRDCGDVAGVLMGNSGHKVIFGLIVVVEFESKE